MLFNKFSYRQFHTSSPRYVHPLIWVFLKPALKGVAWITGRSTRKWYRQLPPEKKSLFMQHLSRHKYKYFGIFGSIGAAVSLHYYTHLETSPITGRRRYMMMNVDQLVTLSEMEKEKIANMFSNKMMPEKSKQTQIVAKVARRILGSNMDISEVKSIKWTVRVVDDEMKNAFALPSGDIYVTRGMLETMSNEDQLAIIIAHELAHAILGHSGERLSYLQIVDIIAVFGAFIIWAILPTDWTSFWVNIIFEKFITFTARLPYSRHLEDEADVIGLMLAAKSCYDVREAVNFWQQAFKAEDQQGGPEFLSTHPSSAKRAENLREKLPWAIDIRQQCKCTPLPENKKLGELHLTKNPDEKIMEPLDKRLGVLNIPVVITAKNEN